MMDYFLGHQEDPSEKIQQAFEKIAGQDMKDLPFLHPNVKIKTFSFQIYEDQWVGAVLTPWMLSIFILPGPGQEWPVRKVSTKMGVKFPRGNLPFIVGDVEGVGQYLTCSLMSPLDKNMSPPAFAQMAQDCMEELLTEPETDPNAPQKKGRRSFLLRKEA